MEVGGYVGVKGVKGGGGTHRVSVHETPDGSGHFARKQDHQKEEELWRGKRSESWAQTSIPVFFPLRFLRKYVLKLNILALCDITKGAMPTRDM